jgi:uncharacterized integral membrane protein
VKINSMIVISFIVLLIILLIQNAQFITFKFLIWTARVPEIAAILLLVTAGFLIGFISAKSGRKKSK